MSLYQGPRLLVPIMVDAMLVDEAVLRIEGGNWARTEADYVGLTKTLNPAFPRTNATARPANNAAKAPNKGIHLQWILPDGLRHGLQEKGQTELVFPKVPNRWLIVRLMLNEQKQLVQKGWMIRSDEITKPSRRAKGTNYLTQDQNGQLKWQLIGKTSDLKNWTGETPYNRTALNAVGPEDITFNSYTINNENVFSLVDSLADVDQQYPNIGNKGKIINYFVCGWYSNPEEDPLYQKSFDEEQLLQQLQALELDIGGLSGLKKAASQFAATYSTAANQSPLMLCHGAIHSLHWFGANNGDQTKSHSQTGKPHIDRNNPDTIPDIIIANSSFDALVTFIQEKLVENDIPEEQVALANDLLYAFQENMLEEYTKPNGQELLEATILQSWFEADSGGTFWEIVKQRDPSEQELQADENISQKLDAQFQQALTPLKVLNESQHKLNSNKALLEARQKELFTCLYAANPRTQSNNKPSWESKTKSLNQKITALQNERNTLNNTIERQKQQVKASLNIDDQAKNPDENFFALKERLCPQYWHPNDPVILVHAAKTAHKYGSDEVLNCRYSGQTLSSLTLRGNGKKISPQLSALPNQGQLPKEVSELLKEFVLLNPNFGDLLSPTDKVLIEKQQTLLWNSEKFEGFDPAYLTQQAGFSGIRPHFRSFQTATPPWSPLFMDWVVYFFPSDGRLPGTQALASKAMSGWQLQDESFHFELAPKAYVPKVDKSIHSHSWTIEGRSLMTSQMPQILKAKMESIFDDKLNQVQREMLETITSLLDGFDLITQRLNGFNEYLAQYDISNDIPIALLAPDKASINAQQLSGTRFGFPKGIPEIIGSKSYANYYPIRSGFLLPHHIRIVDDFGIGLYPTGYTEPIDPDNVLIPQDTETIPKGRAMNSYEVQNTRLVLLQPRLLHPSRIKMEWTDADASQSNRPITQTEQNAPVCGWILPNHLDKSLMIFDAEGKLQGSLVFFQRGNRFYVRKVLDPVSANPNKFEIKNQYLNNFINALLAYNTDAQDNGAALSAFLDEIDKTTWVTDPLGPREKQGLSALIGRPLAVVRARVSMEVKGFFSRYFDFSKPETYNIDKASNPSGVMDVKLPFYVGADHLPNNGLIGYFDESGYSQFQVLTKHSNNNTKYIVERPALDTQLNDDTMSEANKHYRHLTLIMDYRGVVHINSGLLPVFQLELPQSFTKDALANMEVTFRTGPLISDPYQLRMPKPADIRGKLSWIYRAGMQIWRPPEEQEKAQTNTEIKTWENENIDMAPDTASFPAKRNIVHEGWLKLADALKQNKKP